MAAVLCDVPLDPEYDGLTDYLEGWGFALNLIEKNEYILSWEDISSHPLLGKPGKTPYTHSLKNLWEDMPERCFRALQINEWNAFPLEELDRNLSCIYLQGGKPRGILLIRNFSRTLFSIFVIISL